MVSLGKVVSWATHQYSSLLLTVARAGPAANFQVSLDPLCCWVANSSMRCWLCARGQTAL